MNRRDVLAGALMLPTLGAVAAEAATDTPVMVLFRKWVQARDEEECAYNSDPIGDGDTTECLAAAAAVKEVEAQIAEASAIGYRDLVLKIVALTNFGAWAAPGNIAAAKMWAEARELIGGVS